MRLILIVIGNLCVLLAIIGVFLPLLPTTPFVIAAAACYAKSSTTMHRWLVRHKWWGSQLQDWYSHGSISARTKVVAVALLATSIACSVVFVVSLLPARLLLVAIAACVSWFILSRPTLPS
ncbi:MAG: YbaN family protein [Candidatus Andersenbacteria bacterium]